MTVPSDREAAAWDDTFRERGATARSWVCRVCGEDVDSSDLRLHLRGHGLIDQADDEGSADHA